MRAERWPWQTRQWRPPGLHQGMVYANIDGYTIFRAMRRSWVRWFAFDRRGLTSPPLTPRSRVKEKS